MTDMVDFNNNVITECRENAGKVGGMFEGASVLLLHHIGAKSGEERVTPLVYLAEGDRMFIFASNGGAPKHPMWYHNLIAHPTVTVEVGAESFPVRASVLERAERDKYYAKQAAKVTNFGDYERKTTRSFRSSNSPGSEIVAQSVMVTCGG